MSFPQAPIMVTGKATTPHLTPTTNLERCRPLKLAWKEESGGRTGPSVGQLGQWGRGTEGHGNSEEEEMGNSPATAWSQVWGEVGFRNLVGSFCF